MSDPPRHDPMDWFDDIASRSGDPAGVYRNALGHMVATPSTLSPEGELRVRLAVATHDELERQLNWMGTRAALAERALRLLLAGRPAERELDDWRSHCATEEAA